MTRFRHSLLILAGAVTLTMPVHAAEKDVPVTEPATEQLKQRLDKIERTLQSQGLLDMYQQLQQLQEEVNKLRGQLEVNNHELEQLRSRQRDLYNDLDSRLQALREPAQQPEGDNQAAANEPPLEVIEPADDIEAAGERAESGLTVENIETADTEEAPETQSESDTVETADSEATETPPLAEADAGSEEPGKPDPIKAQAEYQQAFKLLKAAKYDQAISAFNTFVRKYPDSQYADNAQYWMAEALYVKRDFEPAITEYMKLVSEYPESQKAPNSLLKIGYSYFEMGKPDEAILALEDLKQRYPDSAAARDAESRLQRSNNE